MAEITEVGPFEAEQVRVDHALNEYAKKSGPAGTDHSSPGGFARSNEVSVDEMLTALGPGESGDAAKPFESKEFRGVLPGGSTVRGRIESDSGEGYEGSSYKVQLSSPSEARSKAGPMQIDGKITVQDTRTGETTEVPLSAARGSSIPGLGKIHKVSNAMGGGESSMELVGDDGSTQVLPVEFSDDYSSFMNGDDLELERSMVDPMGSDPMPVSMDTLSNIRSGSLGKRVRDFSKSAAMSNMSEADTASLAMGDETIDMEPPWENSYEVLEQMDMMSDDDLSLSENMDSFGMLEEFELQAVSDGANITRAMVEEVFDRDMREWNMAFGGRRMRDGLREYVFKTIHPQVGRFEFSYSPEYPDIRDRIRIEKV
jgi:hypothetical protein